MEASELAYFLDYVEDYTRVMKSSIYWESHSLFSDFYASYVSNFISFFRFFRNHITEGSPFSVLSFAILRPGTAAILLAIPIGAIAMSLKFGLMLKNKMQDFYDK